MSIIKKLKALFFKDEQPVSLDLSAAEIREGKAFLHPKHDGKITYLVRSDDIEIRLSKGRTLTDKDVLVVGERKEKKRNETDPKVKSRPRSNAAKQPGSKADNELDRFKKRTFSVSLYPEEYDRLIETIQAYGYKRADFILASANTATKGTMAKEQKKVAKLRKELRLEQRNLKAQKRDS